MGLLDDAIREHLELKRLRGADPSEVAREERAALGPPAVDEDVEEYDSDEPDFAKPGDEVEDYDEEDRPVGGVDRADGEAGLSARGDIPRSSEETMEVDMRTIIDADLRHEDGDLELNGEAMAANAVAYSVGSGGTREVEVGSVDSEARERRRWLGARLVRARGLGGPSVEGSLP